MKYNTNMCSQRKNIGYWTGYLKKTSLVTMTDF